MKRFVLLLLVLALILLISCDRKKDEILKIGPSVGAYATGWKYSSFTGIIQIYFWVLNNGDSNASSYTVKFRITYDLGQIYREYFGEELKVGEQKDLVASYDIGKGRTVSYVEVVSCVCD
jgi:hypothetical protein